MIPWQLRHFRMWLDIRRVSRELSIARRNGRAVLSVSGGVVLR
uniref:Uncharacterized protein n=1 Tax=uncultured prokaryote TaxID=198431 RepID=A0A0H5QLC5_9ZZZZ|nr:hypothetical protein [uncultured prokaryote]